MAVKNRLPVLVSLQEFLVFYLSFFGIYLEALLKQFGNYHWKKSACFGTPVYLVLIGINQAPSCVPLPDELFPESTHCLAVIFSASNSEGRLFSLCAQNDGDIPIRNGNKDVLLERKAKVEQK